MPRIHPSSPPMPASFTHYAPQAMQRPDEKAPCRFCKPLSHSSKAENGLPRRRGRRAMPAWQTCRAGVADVPCRRGKHLGRMLSRKGASRKWLNALYSLLYAFSHFVNHFLRPSARSSPVSRVFLKILLIALPSPTLSSEALEQRCTPVGQNEAGGKPEAFPSCVF